MSGRDEREPARKLHPLVLTVLVLVLAIVGLGVLAVAAMLLQAALAG